MPVLDRSSDTNRPWGVDQLSGKRTSFDFDTVLSDHEFLRRQVEYLSGYIIEYRLFAEIAATPARATRKGMNLYFVWLLDRFERAPRVPCLSA